MITDVLKVGGLYYVYHPTYEEEAPVTICNILSVPRTHIGGHDGETPQLLGRLIQKEPFIVLDVGPVINSYYVFYGEYKPLWVKILYKEIIGWIRIDSDRISEFK